MIEDLMPRSAVPRGVKLVSVTAGLKPTLPVLESHISFLPFLNYLRKMQPEVSGTRADFYTLLINKFEADPTLLEKIENPRQMDSYGELLEFLSSAIFPVVSGDQYNFTLSTPYEFTVFSYSPAFKTLFIDAEEQYLKLPLEMSAKRLWKIQCSMIYDHVLAKYYGIKLNDSPDLVVPVIDKDTGMKRYYRMRYDRRFIELNLKGTLPLIQDCAVCLNTFRILDLEHQLKAMPLDLFEAEGFAVWIAEDITTTECLDRIKKILLRQAGCDTHSILELKEAVHALTGLSDVDIGLMPFFKINNNFLLSRECTQHSILGRHWKDGDAQSRAEFDAFIRFQQENPEPMPITNLDEQLLNFATPLRPVHAAGVRSYVYYPLQNSEGLLGLLELASPKPNLFTQQVIASLEPAIPLLSLAMLKSRDAFNNRIEKIVKEKFTALQPSVEWKFSEAAWDFLQSRQSGTTTEKIIFEDVYPLYGAIDIRNSSVERNIALQKDLKHQLEIIDDTLEKLQQQVHLTLLDGLKFKNNNFQQAIDTVFRPEDEVLISEFLSGEVGPVLRHFQQTNAEGHVIVEHYFQLEQDDVGPFCRHRNNFESTLAAINQCVITYLEKEEEKLQMSYPHYFEKYRTDGIEYNIYIGQSMAPALPFDSLYLKNMRLWQLQSMAEIARITHANLRDFKVPLETTQLILIHHQSISISFRKDERRFDVEGSYNIRYEVMKKRIDKALIKDTHERLTQPGKIAMVYSNQKEAQEYEEYIHFLQSKQLLLPMVEYLDLDEMQGISGLKALRVSVDFQ